MANWRLLCRQCRIPVEIDWLPIPGEWRGQCPNCGRRFESGGYGVIERRIKVNRIRCRKCKDVITSEYTHDFKTCSCGAVSVDGGKSYLKRSAMSPDDYDELSEYEEVETRAAVRRASP